jgi:hypothetical protein
MEYKEITHASLSSSFESKSHYRLENRLLGYGLIPTEKSQDLSSKEMHDDSSRTLSVLSMSSPSFGNLIVIDSSSRGKICYFFIDINDLDVGINILCESKVRRKAPARSNKEFLNHNTKGVGEIILERSSGPRIIK